jgi:hypothetical protein
MRWTVSLYGSWVLCSCVFLVWGVASFVPVPMTSHGRTDPRHLLGMVAQEHQVTTDSSSKQSVRSFDPLLADIIEAEDQRQRNGLELIASENFVSKAVRQVLGSCLTNKYSEGNGECCVVAVKKLCIVDAPPWRTNVKYLSLNEALHLWVYTSGETILWRE